MTFGYVLDYSDPIKARNAVLADMNLWATFGWHPKTDPYSPIYNPFWLAGMLDGDEF
jgi:hypothetical protein